MLLNRAIRQIRPGITRVVSQIVSYSGQTFQDKKTDIWQPYISELPPNPIPGQQSNYQVEYDAFNIAMQKKRKLQYEVSRKKLKLLEPVKCSKVEGTNDEVLEIEVSELLKESPCVSRTVDHSKVVVTTADQSVLPKKTFPVEAWTEYEVDIIQLSSTGDGLGYAPKGNHILVVPFTIPGDRAVAKVYKTFRDYSQTDFVKLLKPSPQREGIVPQCKYFTECGGCQLQMISYDDQLKHKKTIVEKAFKHFSGLSPDEIPPILDTMGSPLQYGYRTKLSPHFSVSRGDSKARKAGLSTTQDEIPNIGFNRKGTSRVMDIEHCPIGTDILNEGMTLERERTAKNISKFDRGATLLLRESTERVFNAKASDTQSANISTVDFDASAISSNLRTDATGNPEIRTKYPEYTDYKTYINDMQGFSTEYIGPYKFINQAGSFFQNNNSILRPFTAYVRDQVNPKFQLSASATDKTEPKTEPESEPEIKYLLDAYCGSGLFTITLSPLFSSALGIDIDRRGIVAARNNAEANKIYNAGFIDADASDLFADVPYPPDQSLVVIDPPRKGASEDFLRQLCKYKAKRVIYVSCNVHTQARDVGMIVRGFEDLEGSCRYEIESLRGFDFFPQTGHVEGVCVLNRVDRE